MNVYATDVFDAPKLRADDRVRLIRMMRITAEKEGRVLVHSTIREQLGEFNVQQRGYWVHGLAAETVPA